MFLHEFQMQIPPLIYAVVNCIDEHGRRAIDQKEMAAGGKTYDASREPVAKLLSYRASWCRGLRCIIPAESIYEPNYESGKAVRWLIQCADHSPMGIAGIYSEWEDPATGSKKFTFSLC